MEKLEKKTKIELIQYALDTFGFITDVDVTKKKLLEIIAGYEEADGLIGAFLRKTGRAVEEYKSTEEVLRTFLAYLDKRCLTPL